MWLQINALSLLYTLGNFLTDEKEIFNINSISCWDLQPNQTTGNSQVTVSIQPFKYHYEVQVKCIILSSPSVWSWVQIVLEPHTVSGNNSSGLCVIGEAQNNNDVHSPSIAYFISWANRFHITSALILPTLSSWGNLNGGGTGDGLNVYALWKRRCIKLSRKIPAWKWGCEGNRRRDRVKRVQLKRPLRRKCD